MTLAILDARDKEYVVVAAGADLIATYVQQAILAGQTAQEVLDAILAAGLSEGVFPSLAAGESGTTDGQYFWVGDAGEVTLYLNDSGTGDEIASLATAAQMALRPTYAEMGYVSAAMRGLPDDGNESLDVTTELEALVAYATGLGLPVRLGPRIYRTDGTTIDLTTPTSGVAGRTLIQSTATGTAGHIIRIMCPGTFEGFDLDGNVSADPSPWDSGNYDSFTGSEGLTIGAVGTPISGVSLKSINVTNVRNAGFKVELGSSVVSHELCTATRCRGNFGDGFIAIGAQEISYKDSRAYDFTRIGFVADTYGDAPGTYCDQISYDNCRAEYGHDASILYGGGEYNAGFWAEKSASVTHRNNTVKNCVQRGYVGATGEAADGREWMQFNAIGCVVDGTETGFLVQALGGVPISAVLTNCDADDIAVTGYAFASGTARDRVELNNCGTVLTGTIDARSSVKLGTGSMVVNGFREKWATTNTTHRDSATVYYGSFGHTGEASGTLVVKDWKTVDNSNVQIGTVPKFLDPAGPSLDLTIERSQILGVQIVAKRIRTKQVEWLRLGSIDCPDVVICGTLYEANSLFAIVIRSTTKRICFRDVLCDFVASGGHIALFNLSNTDVRAKVVFSNYEIIKNFTDNGEAVILTPAGGPAGTIAGTTGANNILASDGVITNTGGATPNSAFFIDSNTDAGGKLHGRGNMMNLTNAVNGTKLATAASFEQWG